MSYRAGDDIPPPLRPRNISRQSTSTITPCRPLSHERTPILSLSQLIERRTSDNAHLRNELECQREKVAASMTFLQEVSMIAVQLQEAVNVFEDVLSGLAIDRDHSDRPKED